MMDEADNYTAAAMNRQIEMVKSMALSLSRYHGFEAEFLSRLANEDAESGEEKYRAAFLDRSAAASKAVEGTEPENWERILENLPRSNLFPVHPWVQAFNELAAGKGLPVKIYDTGPKDYRIAKIKSRKIFGGDISKLDDINRIMIESNNPETHPEICRILSGLNTGNKVAHQEKRVMQGFVSDVYSLKFADGTLSEIAFVPANQVFSSKMTHHALRFRRASSKALPQDEPAVRELYKNTCENIKKAFNAAAHVLKVDARHLDALTLKEFNLAAANQNLKTLEDECLKAVLNRPENKAWKSFIL
jgi:hypothetical protein